jgi:hypothetical protein
VSLSAELGSISSTIEQLIERLDQMATNLDGTPREDVANGLHDVERSLRASYRRLERLMRDDLPD